MLALQQMIDGVVREERTTLMEHEAYALVAEAGIRVPRHVFLPLDTARTGLGARLSDLRSEKVVLKAASPDLPHKSDVGGVNIVPNEIDAVRSAMSEMLVKVGQRAAGALISGVLAVEHVPYGSGLPGSEFLLSLRHDAAFGPVLMFGLGGVLTEWYGDMSKGNSHVVLSADGIGGEFDASTCIAAVRNSIPGRMALSENRLRSKAPLQAEFLGEALAGLARLAHHPPFSKENWLVELEINPLVGIEGRPVALDALARLGTKGEPERPPRPLAAIGRLLHPRSAAVYGASTRSQNAGRIILGNMKAAEGIEYGRLYAIHPEAQRIDRVPCFANAASLPEKVDLAVVSIPAADAPAAIDELVREDRAHAVILIPGGFSETGKQDRAHSIARSLGEGRAKGKGPVLVGGNCLGIVSKGEYNTFFLPNYKLPFHAAPGESLVVISQSGAYLVSFTSNLDGIIFPRASISYGNEMDLTASDFFEYYLEHEDEARVFAFYIEGFPPGEGARFLRLVRRARAAGKAVLVYKAGHTAQGARAAASHTASIAGDYQVAKSLLQGAGALVCETLNMFEDFTKILTMLSWRRAQGRRVGVITNAGFEAGAVSDHLHHLELAEFSPATRDRLRDVLPSIAHVGNPVDTTPMANTRSFIAAVEAIAADDSVDALIVSAVPATPALDILAPDLSGRHRENIFALKSLPGELERVFRSVDKPLIVAIDSGRLYDASALLLERSGVPVFRKIDRAARALAAFIGVPAALTPGGPTAPSPVSVRQR